MMVLDSKKTTICKCYRCGTESTFLLTDEEYTNYIYYMMGGDILIQEVFPNRSASERELLRGGICKECWNEMFGDED